MESETPIFDAEVAKQTINQQTARIKELEAENHRLIYSPDTIYGEKIHAQFLHIAELEAEVTHWKAGYDAALTANAEFLEENSLLKQATGGMHWFKEYRRVATQNAEFTSRLTNAIAHVEDALKYLTYGTK